MKTNLSSDPGISRRSFLKKSALAGLGTVLTRHGYVHAQGADTLRVGLIGCGGRGTGAGIIDCAESAEGIELVAIGDLFQDHMEQAPERIKSNLERRGLSASDIYKVTPDTTFVGFDAYQKVIDSEVDLVILASPPQFRPKHLKAAVDAGKHVFVEKPIAVDPEGVRSVLDSSAKAKENGLTLVAGTQTRRRSGYRELIKRIQDGAIGEITSGRCVRTGGAMRTWRSDERVKRPEWSDLEYEIRRWLFWTWLSGDYIVEMHVHNLDVMNWILNGHPVSCYGVGGRQARTGFEYGNCFDHFALEFVYPNDVRVSYTGTQIDGFHSNTHSNVKGTLGAATFFSSETGITGANAYKYEGADPNPSVLQYSEMIAAIRNNEPINEGRQICESTMTAIMGRTAAYTGKEVAWDWIIKDSQLDLSLPAEEFGGSFGRPVAVPGLTELE